MEEANFLTRFGSEVTIVHRRDEFRASKIMLDRARANKKIKFLMNTVVEDVYGAEKGEVCGAKLRSLATGVTWDQDVDGFFLAIGHVPNTKPFVGQIDLDADGYILSKKDMVWFWGHYLNGDKDKTNPYACPAEASSLRGLPPALVVTAGFDPLRDEGETYAARLQEAGVKTECVRYEGVTHGFVLMAAVLDEARKAIADMGAALKAALKK